MIFPVGMIFPKVDHLEIKVGSSTYIYPIYNLLLRALLSLYSKHEEYWTTTCTSLVLLLCSDLRLNKINEKVQRFIRRRGNTFCSNTIIHVPRYTISNCKNRTPIHIHCTSISEYLSIAKMTSKKPQNGRKNARKAFRPIKVIAPTAHAPVFVESPPNFLRFLFFPTFSSVPPGIQTRASEARTHSSNSNAYTKSVTRYFIF